jgi:hypothetical protein
MKHILLIASLALLGSCSLVKPRIVYINRDSLVTVRETVIRDSIITVPGDTVLVELPGIHDTVFIARSGRASASVAINNGRLRIVANCDEQNILISKLQQELSHYQTTESDSTKTTIITEKYIPGFYKFTFWGFFTLAGVITALLLKSNNVWLTLIATLANIFRSKSKAKK